MTGELLKSESVLHIGQRVEFFLEDDSEKYTSRIEDITETELVVAMPVDDKRRPIIPFPGENLYGRAVGERCQYRFFSTFLDKSAQPIPVWRIRKPEVVERKQNREYVRVKVTIPVKCQVIDLEGVRGPLIDAYTGDISGGGMSFTMTEPIAVGAKVAYTLYDLPEIGMMQGLARVARCAEMDLPQGRRYRVGVTFMDISRAVQNKLIRFIFNIQRKDLARGLTE